MATRQEQAKKMTKARTKRTKLNISKCIDGMFCFEYRRNDDKWNISKIARDSGTSRNSVYKYLSKKKDS
jgi:transcriptional regulator of acetoin/glycerol metabolism